MLKIAVLVSGGGTNLQAIIDKIAEGVITNTEIAVVISNNKNAYALERAKQAGIEAVCVSPKDYENREAVQSGIFKNIRQLSGGFSGTRRLFGSHPACNDHKNIENRIINIHPSLIPSFCGTGYYGLKGA